MLIYLADLTHTGQVVASNVFPLGVGLIGANIMKEIPDARVELFKYPDELGHALQREQPDVVGFSNYSWNCNIGMAYARRIKATWPDVVVIAGGPNYGSTDEEQRDYWQRFGEFVDFYCVKEGERAVVEFLKAGESERLAIPSMHWISDNGDLFRNELMPRVKSLDELPSPYTMGLMDKFFDDVLIPLTHTTRGCPFKCSFCTEGTKYYDAVSKRTSLEEDLAYIGQRRGNLRDLYISDANFGMFKEDTDKADAIQRTQARFGWPQYIHVSGGKNHKERVLEVARRIGGRMGVAASLQSTDPQVLDNVRRSNISVEQLAAVAKTGSRIDANTYAEIILNLPGDTKDKHTKSLRDSVNTGLSYLRMYQLILLPETDMNTREQREKFGLQTRWRIMPRCFGQYTFGDEKFTCAEIEEIVVAQDSMPFEDYVASRELDLTIEIIHNTGLFRELFGLCQVDGVEWFDLLMAFHERRMEFVPDLYTKFREDTIKPLWDSRDEALAFAENNIDLYLTEQLGTNELFNAKAVAFFNLQEQLHDAIYTVALAFFESRAEYLGEVRAFSLRRKRSLLAGDGDTSDDFLYDFAALVESDFAQDPDQHRRVCHIRFAHDGEQTALIEQFVRQYGTTTTGLGRIMLRAHIKKLFRKIYVDGAEYDKGFETSYRRASNLYGD